MNKIIQQPLVLSAHSLQTYVDCARRYELSYLDGLVWPAVEQEPVLESEQFLENGRIFHEMVHQDMLGIPVSVADKDPKIAAWWQSFRESRPADIEGEKFPEKTLVGEAAGQILVATYDLIVITPEEKAVIFDWKTWRHPERKKNLEKRLQSCIYPFLLVQSADTLMEGLSLAPEQIEMRYWFTEKPGEPYVFQYNNTAYEAHQQYLETLVKEMLETEKGNFALTEDTRMCNFCPYRSYCDRGDEAGTLEDNEFLDESDMAVELLGNLDDYEAVAF